MNEKPTPDANRVNTPQGIPDRTDDAMLTTAREWAIAHASFERGHAVALAGVATVRAHAAYELGHKHAEQERRATAEYADAYRHDPASVPVWACAAFLRLAARRQERDHRRPLLIADARKRREREREQASAAEDRERQASPAWASAWTDAGERCSA